MIETGTTPVHVFSDIPQYVCDQIKEIKITYSQNEKEVLVKRTNDCEIANEKIITKLSQEDTFCFDRKYLVDIQMRLLLHNGECLKTPVMTRHVGRCLDDEVLV